MVKILPRNCIYDELEYVMTEKDKSTHNSGNPKLCIFEYYIKLRCTPLLLYFMVFWKLCVFVRTV